MRKQLFALGIAVVATGCSGSSPTAPTRTVVTVVPPVTPAPTPTPAPTSFTLSGTVSATNGNQPLSGLTVSISGYAPAQTTSTGQFSLTLPPLIVPYRVGLFGAGIVERQMMVNVTAGRNVALDVIRQDGTFDLNYYRKLVRNAHESLTGFLQPVRRFSVPPRIYLRTVDDRGTAISSRTLDQTAAVLENAAGEMTGKFGLAGLERGTDTREGQQGWLTVLWIFSGPPGVCGQAQVGSEGGGLRLYYRERDCGCGGFDVAPHIVRHELGHALGFWHTGDSRDLMAGGSWDISLCNSGMTARERYHAAIAYSRPIGNTDPDVDPSSAISAAMLPPGLVFRER